MRQLALQMSVTLDGYVAGPGGELTFATVAQEQGERDAIYCRCPEPPR